MALKKSTAKAKTSTKTTFPAMAAIKEIEHCLEKDNAVLAKSYPKALAELEKDIKRAQKAVVQAKKQSKKTGKAKAIRPDKSDSSSADIHKLSALKNDKAVLLEGYQKFLALQKNTAQFEKQWAKKLKQRAKPKKKSKKGNAVSKNNSAPVSPSAPQDAIKD